MKQEVKGKGSNLTSLLLVEVFAEVAEVIAKALNINPVSLGKNIAEEKPKQNAFSYSYLSIYLPRQKMLKFEG